MRGDLAVARVPAGLLLDLADRMRHRARLAMHRARRPVELAQRVDHRAADADAGVGLETRAAIRGVVRRRFEQAQHARLDEVGDIHRGRQAPGQMVGDAFHQLRVARHERVARAFGARARWL